MSGTFDVVVTLVLIAFTMMLWRASSHPLTSRWVRFAMRIIIALIAFVLVWNLMRTIS